MHDALPGLIENARQRTVRVLEQQRLARDTYRIRLACPEIAQQIVPGQFVMLRQSAGSDPLLGRPFALFDVVDDQHGCPTAIDLVYLVVGKMTRLMQSWRPDDRVVIWGPLGNGFPLPQGGHLMLVAGGIGFTPFPAVAREALGLKLYGQPARRTDHLPERVTVAYGVRTAEYLTPQEAWKLPDVDFRIASDDGTAGHHGPVTDLLEQSLLSDDPPTAVYCCGPEPMMRRAAELCTHYEVPCWVSLESPMACGIGACFSCVVGVPLADGSWDYRRTCVEGPVFPAENVLL